MKLLACFFLLFFPCANASAQSHHHEDWGKARKEVEKRYDREADFQQSFQDSTFTCYDSRRIGARLCLGFCEEKYCSFTLTSANRTLQAIEAELDEKAKQFGMPEGYYADYTPVENLQLALDLAEAYARIVYPADERGTQLSILIGAVLHEGDAPGTYRLSRRYEPAFVSR